MAKTNDTDPLPPLEWLRVFEAAGRLGNFTAAAKEIGLTQAAVSQRMRNLEAHLGVPLFLRLARGVELTAHGEAYLPHVQTALDSVRRGTVDLFSAPRTKISIAAPASVAVLWLAPRLTRISMLHQSLQVSVSSVHRPGDFDATQADLEVRFADLSQTDPDSELLYREEMVPCCAPHLLAEAESDDWRDLPIVAVSGPRDGWQEWANAREESPLAQPVLRFDSMIAAQTAAISGAGVLLASLPLAIRAIEAGDLEQLETEPHQMDGGYWFRWRQPRLSRALKDSFHQLLVE